MIRPPKDRDLPVSVILSAQGGDEHAKERVFTHYRRYSKRVARLFYRQHRGDWEDHLAIAYNSIAVALRFYKPTLNSSFAGYMRVIMTRALMSENRKNTVRFDRTVFVDEEDGLDDCGLAQYEQRFEALSDSTRAFESCDPLPRRVFALLSAGLDFNGACREIGVRPTLARIALAYCLDRAQIQTELIECSLSRGFGEQPVLFRVAPVETTMRRARRVRKRSISECASLFEVPVD